MTRRERIAKILSMLSENNFVSGENLAEFLNVSTGTIRRDLIELEKEGKLRRVHGGAMITSPVSDRMLPLNMTHRKKSLSGDYVLPYEFAEKINFEKGAKIAIAKKAAEQIQPYDSVFISSGSTTYYMIDYIDVRNITVVTDGLPHLFKLAEKGISTYVLEGFANYNRGRLMLTDNGFETLSKLNFSKVFIGTVGVDFNSGFTTASMKDADMKQLVMKIAKQAFILADSSKYNKRSFITFASSDQAILIGNQIPETVDKINYINVKEENDV